MTLKEKIKSNSFLKRASLRLLMPKNDPKPRRWLNMFVNPFIHKKGMDAIIRNHARMDIFPFNKFTLGAKSIIEDFTVINNGVGNVFIGDRTIIGVGSVIIGPVTIGHDVMLAQHIVVSGLNHGYADVSLPPSLQPVTCNEIVIEDNVWIGANAVITAGVTLGKHCIVGAGSIVTKNIPAFTIAVGNPAKVVKIYNETTKTWEPVKQL